MTPAEFQTSLTAKTAPRGVAPALAALWWARKGEWDKAHKIVMDENGRDAAWVHAYLHRKEGDMRNAGGWYSRAGREPAAVSLDEEWLGLAEEMLGVQAVEGARAAMDGFMKLTTAAVIS